MRLDNAQIAAVLRREIQQAQGYDGDVLASKRALALEYYQGLMTEPAEGRSGIVSMDVADSVHGLLSEIQPILKTTMVEFVPENEQDEQQAQAEGDFTRDAIRRNGGWRALFETVHSALLVGNGWLYIGADDYEELEQQEVAELDEYAAAAAMQSGAEVDGTTVTRRTRQKRLKFESVPPEEMLFSNQPGEDSLQRLRFVGRRKRFTVSQLRKMKVTQDVIDRIPDASESYYPGEVAREGIYANSDYEAAQQAERLKEVVCCYIRIDLNDSGTTTLRHVWIGGNEIILNEPAPYGIPYITGGPVPMPHRIQGTGIYELVASIQSGKTHVLRNYMDNLEVMNSSRVGAVEGQVNLSDLTSGRINGVVRMRSPDAIVPLPSNDVGAVAITGLDYLDRVRTQRIGSTVDFNEVQAQIMGSSATAAAGQLAKVEKMAGWFAENLAETILKPAFLAVHRLLRTELAGPVMTRVRGKWQQQDSSQWPPRMITELSMGMTTAQKAQRTAALSAVIQQQAQILQMGGSGVLVDNGRIYNAMADWLRANDLQQVDQYLIDPLSEEAQQAQQAGAEQEQAAQEQQAQFTVQMEQMKQQHEAAMQERELEYKRWSDSMKYDLQEADITSRAVIDTKKLAQEKERASSDAERDERDSRERASERRERAAGKD